jgi:hypothetical protein
MASRKGSGHVWCNILYLDIKNIKTIKSWHDQNSIIVELVDGKTYRLRVNELLKILHLFDFKVVPKAVHRYLELTKDFRKVKK